MKHTPAIIAALMIAALPAFAGTTMSGKAPCCQPAPEEPTFSYNFVEAGWTHLDFDNFGKTDGYYLHASYSPVQSLFVFGEWGQDFGNPDRDLIDLGVGVYIPLVKQIHWVTTAGAGWVNTRAPGNNDEGWAFNASTGLRIRLCKAVELELDYELSVDGNNTDHGASAGLLINLAPKVQLAVRGHFSQDENGFGVGIRYNF